MNEQTNQTLLQHPGVLWQRTIEQTRHAIACGALRSMPTTYEFVEQNGVDFLVRITTNLIRKAQATQQQAQSGHSLNPFLPYEADLFVMNISKTHVCLLNKFNVVDHHLLIITRAFEEQDALLTIDDFEALRACLAEIDGLAFYNGGAVAGASQPHKHLQLVPLPFVPERSRLPVDSVINAALNHAEHSITTVPEFPFVHALSAMNISNSSPQDMLDRYQKLLQTVGIKSDQLMASAPYNLLITRNWMLIVPRSHACYDSIAFNSLAFAGALLVRNQAQLQQLKEIRPLNFLKNVAIAIPPQ